MGMEMVGCVAGWGLILVSGCATIFGTGNDEFAAHEILVVKVLHSALSFFH